MAPPLDVFRRRRSRKISFLDNYYEHGCEIIARDVLLTDVRGGGGAAARASRWWYGLFLVSYRSERARLFFLGSFALRNERLRQFRSHRYIIHPWSQFRSFWHKVVVCCMVVNTYTFTLVTSTLYSRETGRLRAVNVLGELLLLADVALHFHIGYVNEISRSVELDRRQIILHYMSTKLFLHMVTAIPLQMILSLSESGGADAETMSSVFVCALRLLSTLRLVRIMEATRCWTIALREPCAYMRILYMLLFVVLIMNQALCLCDTLTLIKANMEGFLHPQSFLAYMLMQKYVILVPALHLYFLDMMRMFKAFLISSQGFYLNQLPVDRLISLLNYFLAAFFFMWCLLEVAVHFLSANYRLKQKTLALNSAMCFINARQLSGALRERLTEYYRFADVAKVLPPRMNEMFLSLPESIRNEVKITNNSHLLSEIEQFSGLPTPLIHAMTLALKLEVYLSGDIVAHAGSPVERMSIVERGVLAEGAEAGAEGAAAATARLLIDGDHFGAECLAGGGVGGARQRTTDLVALTNCCVVSLHADDFRTIVTNHQAAAPPARQRV